MAKSPRLVLLIMLRPFIGRCVRGLQERVFGARLLPCFKLLDRFSLYFELILCIRKSSHVQQYVALFALLYKDAIFSKMSNIQISSATRVSIANVFRHIR